VCVPLQWGASVTTSQLQLPPVRVSPTNPPVRSARASARGESKHDGCGPAKSSGIAIEIGTPTSARYLRPWASNRMTVIVSLMALTL
jgi:hypothetical protein